MNMLESDGGVLGINEEDAVKGSNDDMLGEENRNSKRKERGGGRIRGIQFFEKNNEEKITLNVIFRFRNGQRCPLPTNLTELKRLNGWKHSVGFANEKKI